MKRFSVIAVLAVGLAAGIGVVTIAIAQPPRTTEGMERERTRMYLVRRLELLEHEQATLQSALQQLHDGAPLDEIREQLKGADEAPEEFEMTPELRERALRVFEATSPEFYERWVELQKDDPERAAQIRERILNRIESDGPLREMMQLLEHDPELFELRAQQFALERKAHMAARRLVEASKRGEESDAAAARTELHQLLGEQLDLRFSEQRMAMKDAEDRLRGMEGRLAEQTENRDELINRRVEELIHRAEQGPGEFDGRRRRGGDRPPPPNPAR